MKRSKPIYCTLQQFRVLANLALNANRLMESFTNRNNRETGELAIKLSSVAEDAALVGITPKVRMKAFCKTVRKKTPKPENKLKPYAVEVLGF